ncbi:hypothetical protein DFS33DRAFT_16993 [Desarmillaria ectypa]|nr:hypothetical protein DFS33DRAFT_16993 [Desarmillaria ectypa]
MSSERRLFARFYPALLCIHSVVVRTFLQSVTGSTFDGLAEVLSFGGILRQVRDLPSSLSRPFVPAGQKIESQQGSRLDYYPKK